MIFIIFIVIIFVVVKFIKFKKESVNIELDSVTFFEGSLGSGKTRLLTSTTIKEFKARVRKYKIFKIIEFLTFNLVKNKYVIPNVYSNYPIYLGKKYGFSRVINTDVLNWEYKIEEDSIVVLDEVGYVFPNQNTKTSEDFVFGITWLRHGTNATVLCASQSLSECNIAFRRKVNRCYHLHNCRKFFWFLSAVEVVPVIISEDIKNVYSSNTNDKMTQRYMFVNPKNNFNSRYGRSLYKLSKNQRLLIANDFTYLLKLLKYENGDYWRSLHYDL